MTNHRKMKHFPFFGLADGTDDVSSIRGSEVMSYFKAEVMPNSFFYQLVNRKAKVHIMLPSFMIGYLKCIAKILQNVKSHIFMAGIKMGNGF